MDKTFKLQLKKLSHQLNPVVTIGNNGLTDAVHKEIAIALSKHELMKIRVSGQDREQRKSITQAIVDKHDADLINTIGHVIVIYKDADDDE